MPKTESLQRKFEQCIDRHADSIYRVAYRLTGNHESANELVQETFLQAWRGLESIEDESKLRAWMFGILRNQNLKMLRKKQRDAKADSEILEFVAEQASDRNTNDAIDSVQSAIALLDEIHRMPVLLVSMEQMSVDEAAEVLELPRGTVLSRLHRGRQKLKEILSRELNRFEH